jgi:hypothetical protein
MPQLPTSREDDIHRLVNDAHYAVVVGINFYQHLGNLAGPSKDATRFCDWLVDDEGGRLRGANVRRVKATEARDGEDLIPTLVDILDTLNSVNMECPASLLAGQVKKEMVAVIRMTSIDARGADDTGYHIGHR